MYSKPFEFTSVHESGHAVCVACFPPPSNEVMEKDHPELPSSNPIANLHSQYFTDEDILPRPSRIKEINILYDEKYKRHDGDVSYNPAGLSNEQRLVITLGGKVAELMAKTVGYWDVKEIQTRFNNREFDTINIKDMQKAYNYLMQINESSQTERSLSEFISIAFSFLVDVWGLVDKIAKIVISTYDPEKRTGKLQYHELPSEIQAQLCQLESTPYLKDI